MIAASGMYPERHFSVDVRSRPVGLSPTREPMGPAFKIYRLFIIRVDTEGTELMPHPKDSQKSSDSVNAASGISLLARQIEAAKQMLLKRPIPSKEYAAWNDQTKACLIQVYGQGSPNIDTIIGASGTAATWLFMPDDAADQYAASVLENKVQMLESCVVALKRKAK